MTMVSPASYQTQVMLAAEADVHARHTKGIRTGLYASTEYVMMIFAAAVAPKPSIPYPTAAPPQLLCDAITRPKIKSPMGPITAGMIIAGSRNSGSACCPWEAVIRVAMRSMRRPPTKNEMTEPMNPERDSKPML